MQAILSTLMLTGGLHAAQTDSLWAAKAATTEPPSPGLDARKTMVQRLAPNYVHLQFAGYTGWLSLGLGYSFWQGRLEPEVLYGFVPSFISKIPVHTVAQKTVLSPSRIRLNNALVYFPVQAGYTTSIVLGEDFFLLPPERYPRKDYYWPTALHVAYFTGTKLRYEFAEKRFPRSAAVYAQVGMPTHYWRSYTYSNEVGLRDVLSLTLGTQTYF